MLKRLIVLKICILVCNLIAGQNRKDVSAIFSNRFPLAYQEAEIANQNEYNKSNKINKPILKLPILFYQVFIAPQLKPHCYFYPSCSHFALEAVAQYGLLGVFLSADRMMRCNPMAEYRYPFFENSMLLFDPVNRYNPEKCSTGIRNQN